VFYIYVGIGGVLGAISRYAISKAINERIGFVFPVGTLVVNITGAFLLSLLLGLGIAHQGPAGKGLELALTTGFLGAYTTFSTFSYEALQLIQDGEHFRALGYVTLSVIFGLLAAWLGILASASLVQ